MFLPQSLKDWWDRFYFYVVDVSDIPGKLLAMRITMMVFVLLAIGIVMVYSSSFVYAMEQFSDPYYFLKRELFFSALAIVVFVVGIKLDLELLRRFSKPLVVFSILLLIMVLVPHVGRQVGGARRWLPLGPFNFQPSEFAQITLLIYASDYFTRKYKLHKRYISDFKDMLPVFVVVGIMLGLIVIEPDLGTVMVSAGVFFILMFVAGFRMLYLLSLAFVSSPIIYFLIFAVPYRRARVLSFLNPWKDPLNTGFQLIQSQIALGNGGIWGLGLGNSLQKMFYLPAAHTDFILSIIGEELGLIGVIAVVLVFLYLLIQSFAVVLRARTVFERFLALSMACLIWIETIVNMGVSMGLMPTKGLPLPFISYGGTSLVMDMFAVGILVGIALNAKKG